MDMFKYINENFSLKSNPNWKKVVDTALDYNGDDKEHLIHYTFYIVLRRNQTEAINYLLSVYYNKDSLNSFFEDFIEDLCIIYESMKKHGITVPKKYYKKSVILNLENCSKYDLQSYSMRQDTGGRGLPTSTEIRYLNKYFDEYPEDLQENRDEELDKFKKYINNGKFKTYGNGPYFGCELEIAFHNENDKQNCLNDLWDHKYGFHLVNEADVPSGFEIITDVFGFENIILLFKKIFKIIKKYDAYCTQKCGFHIHIDKTDEVLDKCKKVFTDDNQKSLELIGLREKKGFGSSITVDKHDNFSTIEIRIFRCTTMLRNVIGYIVFTNDLITKDIDTLNKKYKLIKKKEL